MQSFRGALNEVRPRTPLLLFNLPATHGLVAFSRMVRDEYVRPIKEYYADPRNSFFYVDPQLELFEP